jgi:hypothetical protein
MSAPNFSASPPAAVFELKARPELKKLKTIQDVPRLAGN